MPNDQRRRKILLRSNQRSRSVYLAYSAHPSVSSWIVGPKPHWTVASYHSRPQLVVDSPRWNWADGSEWDRGRDVLCDWERENELMFDWKDSVWNCWFSIECRWMPWGLYHCKSRDRDFPELTFRTAAWKDCSLEVSDRNCRLLCSVIRTQVARLRILSVLVWMRQDLIHVWSNTARDLGHSRSADHWLLSTRRKRLTSFATTLSIFSGYRSICSSGRLSDDFMFIWWTSSLNESFGS